VLGTGGASLAIAYVLRRLGIGYCYVSHSGKGDYSYQQLTPDVISAYPLIINTTPVGMYPENGRPDIPYQALGAQHLLYDLIYNPGETRFLQGGREQGATVKNGLEMLHLQAEASWQIWNT